MSNLLTEQDTFFGSISFRNGLVTREQLSEGVLKVQSTPGQRLGEALVQLGYLSESQADAILTMQKEQRDVLAEQRASQPSEAAPPPAPAETEAESVPSAPKPEPSIAEPEPVIAEPSPPKSGAGMDFSMPSTRSAEPDPEPSAPKIIELDAPVEVPQSPTQTVTEPQSPRAAASEPDEAPDSEAPTLTPYEEPPELPRPKSIREETAEASPPPTPATEERPPSPPPAAEPERREAVLPSVAQALPSAAAEAPPGQRAISDYLADARASGASDLHISAEVRPFLRKAGEIVDLAGAPLPAHETERLLFSLLTAQQKAGLLEDMGLEFCLDVPDQGRYRATIVKQRCGWDGIFHIVRECVPTLEELGLPDCLLRLTEYQQGLVLVTGPGNSGKTTTLAALVDAINRTRSDHIITVEKPVEYVHASQKCQITQREVGSHTASFSIALRAALREDPDVIMVGELHDLETLSMAISASETGHLVLGTLHTTSAASTVGRVVDAFPASQQSQIRMMVSESLRGIVSQQLVPRIDGSGVALALEILFVTQPASALIRDDQPHQIPSVMQMGRKMGMRRMDDSLLELVEQGIITGDEAYRRADNRAAFEMHRSDGV